MSGENTFIGWVGEQGTIDLEKLTDGQIIDDILRVINKFTGIQAPYPRRYYMWESDILIKEKIFARIFYSSRWDEYPYTLGSYSYPSVNCDALGITPNDLARPITAHDLLFSDKRAKTDDDSKPLLLFAGEGVHQYFWSTAHGAFLSGEHQAKVILYYRKKLRHGK